MKLLPFCSVLDTSRTSLLERPTNKATSSNVFALTSLSTSAFLSMKTRKRLLLSLLAASIVRPAANSFLGIPGNIASDNGYDNGGDEQVCWLARSASAYNDVVANLLGDFQAMDNPLLNFTAVGDVELYATCPAGTLLEVYPPPNLGTYGAVTQRNYSFLVNGTLDLRE